MLIKNGLVFCEDKQFHNCTVQILNGIITRIIQENEYIDDSDTYDAKGMYVIPGLVDVHSHGAIGSDFSDADVDGLMNILSYERSHGITSYCPTTMTINHNEILNVLQSIIPVQNTYNKAKHARILGVNLEGPFLDPEKKGAHDKNYIMVPSAEFFHKCQTACKNQICLVTLAPNIEGADVFISELKEDVNISLGHTSCNYFEAMNAFALGANHVTHLYNAMNPLNHRNPGLIGAASDNENVWVELISDGIHCNESIVRLTFKLFKNRVVLISDSMRATGLKDGEYDLGGQIVNVSGKLATLRDGTIAGSCTNLFDCMKTAISYGISKEEAVAAATINPATSIGKSDIGVISEGKVADILIVNSNWNLVKVI